MSHKFLENGRCEHCGQMIADMTRGADEKLPFCPDAPNSQLVAAPFSFADCASMSADAKRQFLYSDAGIPEEWRACARQVGEGKPSTRFGDHAWGNIPPYAMFKALQRMYSLYTRLGSLSWGTVAMEDMPEAARRVKQMFGYAPNSEDAYIEFAPNTHTLTAQIMSDRFDRIMADQCTRPLRVLTSTDEFYSITRQLNRYISADTPRLVVETVSAEPVETFSERAVAYVSNSPHKFDFIYFSQISYLQRTLVPDIRGFVADMRAVLEGPHKDNADAIIIMDVYNAFGAFPLELAGVDCVSVTGTLKHMCCGPNVCFGVIPKKYGNLRPMITGWRADVSLYSADSPGIAIGDPVHFMPGLNMTGSTPPYNYGIIMFNQVCAAWEACGITAASVHEHLLTIHARFLAGLERMQAEGRENPFINMKRYLYQAEATRSHTLVFVQNTPTEAKTLVEYLTSQSIALDNRKNYVRIGFGLNHNPEDVDLLLGVIARYLG